MRILLIEDDELLADATIKSLKLEGYTVDHFSDGESAIRAVLFEDFDLMLLDIGLPKKSGLEVLEHIRNKKIKLPVIFLTARDQLEDQIKGLDLGADDYITKPFEIEPLCARIRSCLRRSNQVAESVFKCGKLTLDPSKHLVKVNKKSVEIPNKEYKLLEYLMSKKDHVVSKETLEQNLYGYEDDVESNAIEVHIHNLRKKFEGNIHIRTVRGVGYILESPK
jgi:two-component system, OmpR family, response regulator QseB